MVKTVAPFPRIPRRIAALLWLWVTRGLLWTGTAAFLAVNILSVQHGLPFSDGLLSDLLTHENSITHVEIARRFWESGDREAAGRELALARENLLVRPREPRAPGVLGVTTDPQRILSLWENEPKSLSQKLAFWERVSLEKRDYRDAFILTALYAYQLKKYGKAKDYLNRALTIDPNASLDPILSELLATIN